MRIHFLRLFKFLKNRTFPILAFFLLCTGDVSAQTLDGTEGEVFEDRTADSIRKARFANWNAFESSLSTLKFGGGLLYDFGAYVQDENSKKQVGEIEPDIKMRDFRITMSGRLKFNRDITWRVGMMYDGEKASWFLRESGVMVHLPEISGYIFAGRTKEGYSLSKVMVGYAIFNQERTMAIDVIPILADGVKYLGFLPKQKINWNIGVFSNRLSEDQSFATYKWQFVSRIAWLPVYTDATKPVLHIGMNYRYGEVKNNTLQLRSKPESSTAPYFVATGTFNVNSSNSFGPEIYYRTGPLLLGMEYHFHQMNSPENDNPIFKGGEVFVAYNITGEVRPYFVNTGIFTFLKVKNSVFKGGGGAWEAILRFSTMDLDEGKIQGGTYWRIAPGFSWHLSGNVRLSGAYGYGILKRYGIEGSSHIFQTRLLFML